MPQPAAATLDAAPDAHAEFLRRRHFGSLDGLRAISILAVMWHHTLGHEPGLPRVLYAGPHGVTLFFAISGFLIVTLLLRERERRGRIDLPAFYMRRTLRIFPLYFAVLALYVVLVAVMERDSEAGREFFRNLPYFATYTTNWFVALEGRVIFYFSWSLAAEEQFYLFWPSVQKLITPWRALLVMLLVIAAIVAVQWSGTPPGPGADPLWRRIVASVPFAICFGVVLAHLLHHRASHGWMGLLFGWRASSAVMLAVTALLLNQKGVPAIAVHLAMALLVGSCVYREDHLLARVLMHPAVAYIGTISYGMYLLHMLAKNTAVLALGRLQLQESGLLVFGSTVALTLIAAGLSYRYFESYFLRLKTRYEVPGKTTWSPDTHAQR